MPQHTMDHERKFEWQNRVQYVMALLCQTVGTTTYISLPLVAITQGATGCIFGFILAHLILGIPLLYMEYIVSQFTARDCLQVWTLRPCLSHIGYVHILWQFLYILYNHTLVAFIIHYFLISFENPVPYFICGKWSTSNCGILKTNYTLNLDCIKNVEESYSYCKNVPKTFPEYQYWRFFILGQGQSQMHVAWRVCLASGIACIIIFLVCFRKKQSLKWFLGVLNICPFIGYVILMTGSMMQKGVVKWYAQSIDADFEVFKINYSVSNIIQQVLFILNIGSGLSFNMGASTSFRAPVYSNVVITVAICSALTVFSACTMAMLPCPFANAYGTLPNIFTKFDITLLFERIPTLLREYENSHSYLILIFSSNCVVGLSTNIITIHLMLEMLANRFQIVANYPGFACFIYLTILFFLTMPLLGSDGVNTLVTIRRTLLFLSIFVTTIECYVFILWYGLEKFSEDVHFMQGIRPGCILKAAWILCTVIVSGVFCFEFYKLVKFLNFNRWTIYFGFYLTCFVIGWIVLIMLARLAVAAVGKRFRKHVAMDPSWGPRNVILLRSRAMFAAQAMTKEYIYRQYHLQARLMERQKSSNVRTVDLNDE